MVAIRIALHGKKKMKLLGNNKVAFKEKQFTVDLKKFGLSNIRANQTYGINKILFQILGETHFSENYSEIEDRCAEISWMCSRMKDKILSYDPKWTEPSEPEGSHDQGLKQAGPGKRTVCAVVRRLAFLTDSDKEIAEGLCGQLMWYTKGVFHQTLSRYNTNYDSQDPDKAIVRDLGAWDALTKW